MKSFFILDLGGRNWKAEAALHTKFAWAILLDAKGFTLPPLYSGDSQLLSKSRLHLFVLFETRLLCIPLVVLELTL